MLGLVPWQQALQGMTPALLADADEDEDGLVCVLLSSGFAQASWRPLVSPPAVHVLPFVLPLVLLIVCVLPAVDALPFQPKFTINPRAAN